MNRRDFRDADYHAYHKRQLLAESQMASAIIKGHIEKPDSCSVCGRSYRAPHAHHEDYDKPLVAVWLCASCHSKLHGRRGDNSIVCLTRKFRRLYTIANLREDYEKWAKEYPRMAAL